MNVCGFHLQMVNANEDGVKDDFICTWIPAGFLDVNRSMRVPGWIMSMLVIRVTSVYWQGREELRIPSALYGLYPTLQSSPTSLIV